jgi:S-DNA-T family DNA segregation ATPase FtsK/SpoIIIE
MSGKNAAPGESAVASTAAAVGSGLSVLVRAGWRYRRELAPVVVAAGLVWALGRVMPAWVAALVVAGAAGGLAAVPRVRRWFVGWLRCGRTYRQLAAGLAAAKVVTPDGEIPRIRRVRPTPVGEVAELQARPGHFAELVEFRGLELRAALKARAVLVDRDPDRSDRIWVDVVRRDPFAGGGVVPWRDAAAEQLSMWSPIHLGVSDRGVPVELRLAGAHLLVGGATGSGKSSCLSIIAAHAAKSPDAHLLLIDPNSVQLSPWKHRALAFADDSVADAIEVLALVHDEISRRTKLLTSLPGVVRKVDPTVMAEHGLSWWVLLVDELAYHTSVGGNSKTQAEFSMLARDIVARGRAMGITAVMGTQRPTQDVVPRALADLFPLRCAFKVNNASNSDVILGDGWVKRGWNAAEIDHATPGVGILLADGGKPQRFKAAWVDDTAIAELAVSTIPLRPAPPTAPGAADAGTGSDEKPAPPPASGSSRAAAGGDQPRSAR